MKKILVIDDDPGILEAIRAILEFGGHIVETTADTNYVNTLNEDKLPDIILVDFLLSGKDGKEVIRQLKNDDLRKKIPVIMLSAHPSAEKAAKEAGADDFLAKPFELEELLSIVKKY